MDKIMSVLTPVLNIIEAILLLICAFIVASIVKTLVLRLLAKTKLRSQLYKDVADGKTDGEASDTAKEPSKDQESHAAEFIGALIYLIIFLLFIPAIFSLLGIRNASQPLTSMFESFWNHLPNILACIVILVVGFMLAKLVRQLLIPIFRRLKVDKIQEKASPVVDKASEKLLEVELIKQLKEGINSVGDLIDTFGSKDAAENMNQLFFAQY